MYKYVIILGSFLTICLVGPALVQAQSDGDLDLDFGGLGWVYFDYGGLDSGRAVALQSDGKIVMAGYTHDRGLGNFALVRFNSDGTVDGDFGIAGQVITDFDMANDEAHAMVIQSDGRIVVGGSAVVGGDEDFALARYNTDGSLDTTFGVGGLVTTDFYGGGWRDRIYALALDYQDRIIAVGSAENVGDSDFALARYRTTGELDRTFGPAATGLVTTNFGFIGDRAYAVTIQNGEKIVVGGQAGSSGSNSDFALARYNLDGALDGDFSDDGQLTTDFGTTTSYCSALLIQNEERIIAAGRAGTSMEVCDFALAGYYDGGRLDNEFGNGGLVTTRFDYGRSAILAAALQDNGMIVAVGWTGIWNLDQCFALAHYGVDGLLDTGFGAQGMVTTCFSTFNAAEAVAIQPNDYIVAAGWVGFETDSIDYAVARYINSAFGGPGIKGKGVGGCFITNTLK